MQQCVAVVSPWCTNIYKEDWIPAKCACQCSCWSLTCDVELVTMEPADRRRGSPLWQHFELISPNKVLHTIYLHPSCILRASFLHPSCILYPSILFLSSICLFCWAVSASRDHSLCSMLETLERSHHNHLIFCWIYLNVYWNHSDTFLISASLAL